MPVLTRAQIERLKDLYAHKDDVRVTDENQDEAVQMQIGKPMFAFLQAMDEQFGDVLATLEALSVDAEKKSDS